MKKSIFALLVLSCFLNPAYALGSKRPALKNDSAKAPGVIISQPTIDLGLEVDPLEYLNASAVVGPKVDQSEKQLELTTARSSVNPDSADKCISDEKPHDLFSDQISFYTARMLSDLPAMVGGIGSYYGTSENNKDYFPTSLIRHPLCQVTPATLKKTLKNVPSQKTIDKLNRYTNKVNSLRNQVIAGDMSAKVELLHTWSRFFSCLGYTESLGAADSENSKKVAAKYAPAGYRRPSGVEFFEDPAQPKESRLNIGMFQFTPTSSGNIRPCLLAWNEIHKQNKQSCLINTKGSQSEMIKILGSSLQSFNAFCGVHKLIQTFSIQVNTSWASATHPNNLVKGNLLPSEQRCVSPYFLAGKAYNHFGPFQNSTGNNMDKFFSCIERSEN